MPLAYRGGSTSVSRWIRSPHSSGSLAEPSWPRRGGTDRRTDVRIASSLDAPGRRHNKGCGRDYIIFLYGHGQGRAPIPKQLKVGVLRCNLNETIKFLRHLRLFFKCERRSILMTPPRLSGFIADDGQSVTNVNAKGDARDVARSPE